jgi:hypothetical protein
VSHWYEKAIEAGSDHALHWVALTSWVAFSCRPERLLAQREDGDWNSKPAKQLVEQSSFLPIGVVRRAQPDENVVCVECGEGILECKEWIVGSDGSARLRSKLLDLAQDRLKALVGLLARLVGCRSQPLEPSWQCRCDHQDLIGRIYELADSERQRVGAVSCLTGRDQ